MRQTVMWAELRNDQRSILVPSDDWETILMQSASLCKGGRERRIDSRSGWLWTESEAAALADKLELDGYNACHGFVGRDGAGPLIRATLIPLLVADGLTVRERTERLASFLREAAFTWRFISATYNAPEDEL